MKVAADEFVRLLLAEIDSIDRAARRLTRHHAEADDLVQETFLNAFKARESFDLQSFGVRPWLLRILHNLYVTRGRREARQPKAVEKDRLEAAVIEQTDWAGPEFSMSDDRVEAALDALPADSRAILMLWAVDELSYKEIAHVLAIPIGTVMSRLFRAKKQIATLLADHPEARPTP